MLVCLLRIDVWQRVHRSVDCALQEHFQEERSSWYGELLAQLDDAAARQIREELSQLAQLTEPHVAHDLSQALPAGEPAAMNVSAMCARCVLQQAVGIVSGMPRIVSLQRFQVEAEASLLLRREWALSGQQHAHPGHGHVWRMPQLSSLDTSSCATGESAAIPSSSSMLLTLSLSQETQFALSFLTDSWSCSW